MSERNRLKVGRIRADRGGESAFDVPHRPLDDDRRPAGQGDAGDRGAANVLKALELGFREAAALVGADMAPGTRRSSETASAGGSPRALGK